MDIKDKSYIYQLLLLMLISLVILKPSFQLINSLNTEKTDIELNESTEDFEEFETKLNEDIIPQDYLLVSKLISLQSKIVFDSYSKQATNLALDVSIPPPKL